MHCIAVVSKFGILIPTEYLKKKNHVAQFTLRVNVPNVLCFIWICFVLDLTIKTDNKLGLRRLATSIGIRNMNCIRYDIYPMPVQQQ